MQDKRPYNEKGLPHGLHEVYWDNGNLWYKGTYIKNKRNGLWIFYWENGTIMAKGEYIKGEQIGFWLDGD